MVKWGITGGIGAGKSFIAKQLREKLNMPIYDCDSRAKYLIGTDSTLRSELIRIVGPQVYDQENQLVRSELAAYLFASEANAQQIDRLVHPRVRQDFRHWASLQTKEFVGMESAILFESGFNTEVDKVLFVDAPLELRIERAMKRDGVSRESVERRISHQHHEQYLSQADIVFYNDGEQDIMNLIRQITN